MGWGWFQIIKFQVVIFLPIYPPFSLCEPGYDQDKICRSTWEWVGGSKVIKFIFTLSFFFLFFFVCLFIYLVYLCVTDGPTWMKYDMSPWSG